MMSLWNIHGNAQVFYGKADKDTIVAGQEFDYKLSLSIPQNYDVEWRQFNDTLGKSIYVKNVGDVTKQDIKDQKMVLTRHLTLTAFDSGYVSIPEIAISYNKGGEDSTRHYLYSDEYKIYVQAQAVDTTQAFKEIVAPISQNITLKEIIPWVVIVVIIGGVVFLIVITIKRSKKKVKVVVPKKKPKIPAIVTARAKLSDMKNNELWNSSKTKDYYTELTDIAREYLEGQFEIDAIEMTTDEIVDAVNKLNLSKMTKAKLQDTLVTADFVKFAKANPSTDQNKQSFNDINSFVEDSYVYFKEEEKRKKEEENK